MLPIKDWCVVISEVKYHTLVKSTVRAHNYYISQFLMPCVVVMIDHLHCYMLGVVLVELFLALG